MSPLPVSETDTRLDERLLLGEEELHVHHRLMGHAVHRACDAGTPGKVRESHDEPLTCADCIELIELGFPCACGYQP